MKMSVKLGRLEGSLADVQRRIQEQEDKGRTPNSLYARRDTLQQQKRRRGK